MKRLSKNEREKLYKIISQNIKKYRKAKGLTQEGLAEKINSSSNFIGKLESNTPQGISLETAFIISKVLDVDLYKFFILDNNDNYLIKAVKYKCNKCGHETDIPIEVIQLFKNINSIIGNSTLPSFSCTNCDGKLYPLNPNDL